MFLFCRRLKSWKSLEPKTNVSKRSVGYPKSGIIPLKCDFFILIRLCVYLSAAVGRPVASLLVSPLPADLSDCVLPLPTWTMVAQTSHGFAFLHISCVVSAHVILQYLLHKPSAKYRCIIFNLLHSILHVSCHSCSYSKHEQVLLLPDKVKLEIDNPEKRHLLASFSHHQGLVHQETVDLPFFQTYWEKQ